jgi:SWI/SNF-related matrix-associated actin-dependent regulator of chromatin subfamily A3
LLAHTIRNQNTKYFRAITSLTGKIRWSITGTPLQNKLEDLGALVRFLQIPSLSTPKEFKRQCIEPVERKGVDGFDKIRALLQIICIRRTQGLLQLPEHETMEHTLKFSEFERSEYLQVGKAYRATIDDAICGRKPADAYSSILKALLKLRLICNYGKSPVTTTTSPTEDREVDLQALLQDGPATCVYCGIEIAADGSEEESLALKLPSCAHLVCFGCRETYLADLEKSANCPTCSVALQKGSATLLQQAASRVDGTEQADEYISTKFKKLLEDVKAHLSTEKW